VNAPNANTAIRSSWRQLMPTITIALAIVVLILLLAEDVRNWAFSIFHPLLDWTRDTGNAGAVQAITAVLQAIGTISLLFLTWHATNTSRQLANDAQRMTAREASRGWFQSVRARRDADRQATLATLPVLAFRTPTVEGDTAFGLLGFLLTNVGLGSAVSASVELSGGAIPYKIDRAGEEFTIRAGDEEPIRLTATLGDEWTGVTAPAVLESHGWVPLAKLTARCWDIRGNRWEHRADLVWDSNGRVLRFANPEYAFP